MWALLVAGEYGVNEGAGTPLALGPSHMDNVELVEVGGLSSMSFAHLSCQERTRRGVFSYSVADAAEIGPHLLDGDGIGLDASLAAGFYDGERCL